MPLKELLEWIEANPFTPFRLRLTDGRDYEVRSPNQIWPGRQSALIGFPTADDARVYDRHVTVSLLHIINIEPISSPAQTGDGAH